MGFMSEKTVSVRFDWVLSAASFTRHALEEGFDKSKLVRFLAHEGMTKLEVRSAVYLKNEHSELLPRVNTADSDHTVLLTNEMSGNAMYSLFLNSKWAVKSIRADADVVNGNNANKSMKSKNGKKSPVHQKVASILFKEE